jgi:hypothetical protein
VIGGYIYRGCRMSDLHGTYFYADHCSNEIDTFRTDSSCSVSEPIERTVDLHPGGGLAISQITSFGEDSRGEIYIVDRAGEVFKLLPTLSIMEVSGQNATAFQPGGSSGDWSWEDLAASSSHPIMRYRVYRSSLAAGPFSCVHQGVSTSWTGGDPATPVSGQVFYYLVSALNGSGEETSPGYFSAGTVRDVDTSSACN